MAHLGQQYHQNMVHNLRVPLTFDNVGTTLSMGRLPARALVISVGVGVYTAFNSATTATLDIGFRDAEDGTADNPDAYLSGSNIKTVGLKQTNTVAGAASVYLPEGAEVTALAGETGAAATAGKAFAFVTYVVDNSEPEV